MKLLSLTAAAVGLLALSASAWAAPRNAGSGTFGGGTQWWPNYGWPYYDYAWPYMTSFDNNSYGGTITLTYRRVDFVAELQRDLKRAGYYHGGINGATGSETRAAISTYQAKHGLPVTGRIDTPLVKSLMFSRRSGG